MRAIVTGGAGFIGSHTVDLLIKRGWEVWIIDDLSTNNPVVNQQARLCRVDISCPTYEEHRALRDAFAEAQPQCVIHLAAQPSVYSSIAFPVKDAEINVMGTLNVLDFALSAGVSRIVFSSTGAVYGTSWHLPFMEDDVPQPLSPYGASKYAAELYIRSARFVKEFVVLRYGNVYGPRQVRIGENQLIPRAIRHMLGQGEERFRIYGDGEQTRDFVYVGDVAAANVKAAEGMESGTFNVATNRPVKVNTVLRHLRELTGFRGELTHADPIPNEPRELYLASDRIERAFGWRPQWSLEDGLAAAVEYWRGQ